MAVTNDDLKDFYQFAAAKLASRGAESLLELVDMWELEHPTRELHEQNVAAVQAAIRDMENGDTGRPADKIIHELRTELTSRRKQ